MGGIGEDGRRRGSGDDEEGRMASSSMTICVGMGGCVGGLFIFLSLQFLTGCFFNN